MIYHRKKNCYKKEPLYSLHQRLHTITQIVLLMQTKRSATTMFYKIIAILFLKKENKISLWNSPQETLF